MLVRLRCQCTQIVAGGGDPEDERGIDRKRMPHGSWRVARIEHGECEASHKSQGAGLGICGWLLFGFSFKIGDAIRLRPVADVTSFPS